MNRRGKYRDTSIREAHCLLRKGFGGLYDTTNERAT